MNGLIRVEYIQHKYNLKVENYEGALLMEGDIYNSDIKKFLNNLSDRRIASLNWFINKANETYVYDINTDKLKLGDWGCSFIIEGGYLEDWNTYNIVRG